MALLQMERLKGGDEEVNERGRSCPLNPWLIMVNTPSKSSHVGYATVFVCSGHIRDFV